MKILHDFHIHTDLSVCARESATLENYLAIADRLGLTKLGFANHFWDERIEGANGFYKPQNFEHLCRLKPALEAAKAPGRTLYFGCETEYDPFHHGVAVTEERAEQFDFIIVPNSHTHMMMPKEYYEPHERHLNFMVQAYEEILDSPVSRYITAMAHPFEAVCCPYDNKILLRMMSGDLMKRLFDKTAERGIAVEINVASMQKKTHEEIERMPQIGLFAAAKECGCKFLFGSDAHTNLSHDHYGSAEFVAELLGLTEEDLADIAR